MSRLAEASTPLERLAVEGSERGRWLDRLVGLLQEADLPMVGMAAGTADPGGALRHAAGALKSRTLRARIRTWEKMRFWLLHTHQVVFPRELGHVVDYLEERVQ